MSAGGCHRHKGQPPHYGSWDDCHIVANRMTATQWQDVTSAERRSWMRENKLPQIGD